MRSRRMRSRRTGAPRGPGTALLILALLGCLGAAALPATASPRDRLDRIDREQERVERRLERVNAIGDRLAGRIAALDLRRAAVESALGELDLRITALDRTIRDLEDRLRATQQRIAELSQRIEAIEARLRRREDLFHERAVSAYKSGATGAFDALLSTTSLTDLIERIAYFESALDADATLVGQIKDLEAEVSRRRAEVEDKKEQLAADKLALQESRSRMAAIRSRQADVLAARQAAIARKRSLLAGVRAKQGKLTEVRRQLAGESSRIEALLAARAAGATVAPGAGGQLAWPAAGEVTSGYGYRVHPLFGDRRLHTGLDIAAAQGSPVYSAGDGIVAYVGALSGYGNVVAVDHGGGLATTYNHLSEYLVDSGQPVTRGQHIAAVGCTGFCTGPHLHFEVRVNGTPVDPVPYLQ
jgi:murein DD-endopeptidase MepM/ murein hydrolase activator NlpD